MFRLIKGCIPDMLGWNEDVKAMESDVILNDFVYKKKKIYFCELLLQY